MDKLDALRTSSLMRALSDNELQSLASIANEREFSPGQRLINAGDTGAVAMYVILEGKVEVARQGTHLSVLGPGNHIGEMALLAPDDMPRTADVTAVEPTRVLQIAKWDIFPFLDTNPEVAKALITELARRLALADDRLIRILAGEPS
ncbi:MAG: Crp/Fnr family transcriptional regulator [Actinomycetota bacterium]